jgi:internalin A
MRTLAFLAAAFLAGAALADEAEAIKGLEMVGGRATKDRKLPGMPVVEVFAANIKTPDAGMKEIKSFSKLRRVSFMNSRVTDEGLKGISALKELKVLGLYGNQFTKASLKEIGRMAQLEELDLGFNRLKTEDIQEIAGLKNLRTLRLTNSLQVKDDAMKVVAGFEKLEKLELAISGVGDKGIAYLAP